MWNVILSKNTHTRCHNRWKMVTLFLMGFDTSNLFLDLLSGNPMVNTCLDVFFGAIQSRKYNPNITPPVPSGKRLHNYGKIHHFSWVNPLFLWPFSIANCKRLPGRVVHGVAKHRAPGVPKLFGKTVRRHRSTSPMTTLYHPVPANRPKWYQKRGVRVFIQSR
jgi:hypothetical protein